MRRAKGQVYSTETRIHYELFMIAGMISGDIRDRLRGEMPCYAGSHEEHSFAADRGLQFDPSAIKRSRGQGQRDREADGHAPFAGR